MKNSLIFSFLVCLIFTSCGDDDESIMTKPPEDPIISFGSISPTDANGSPLGNEDPSDWNLEDIWETVEERLFTRTADLCPSSSENRIFPAFPNPASDVTGLSFNLSDSSDLEVKIVDRNYMVLQELEVSNVFGPGGNVVYLNLENINITDTVRVYYKLTRDNCELRGHGDLVMQ